MTLVLPVAICLVLLGVAGGALGIVRRQRRQLARCADDIAALRTRLAEANGAAEQLAVLQAQTASLRHDLRGILSPALLSADRLISSQDPAIRKVGDIVIRCVERAAARMAETKRPQGASNSPKA